MEKIAEIYFDDFFAWGVWQKERYTGEKYMTYKEIRDYANLVGAVADKKNIEMTAHLGGGDVDYFAHAYRDYITMQDDRITLNDNVSYEDALNIFHMGTVPFHIVNLLLDESVANALFSKHIGNDKQNTVESLEQDNFVL